MQLRAHKYLFAKDTLGDVYLVGKSQWTDPAKEQAFGSRTEEWSKGKESAGFWPHDKRSEVSYNKGIEKCQL